MSTIVWGTLVVIFAAIVAAAIVKRATRISAMDYEYPSENGDGESS